MSRGGVAYVSIKVLHRNNINTSDIRGIYVKVGDLRIPIKGVLVRTHVVI